MLTVMVVEDEFIEREALKKILTDEFFSICLLEAKTGREAISHLECNASLDLILLDIKIPAPNGIAVLQFLREQKGSTAKVIVTTANDDFDTAKMMITLKADEYLLKPIRPKLLIETIYALLSIDRVQNLRQAQFEQCCEYIDQDDYSGLCDLLRVEIANAENNNQAVIALLVRLILHYPSLKSEQERWMAQLTLFSSYQHIDIFYKYMSLFVQEMYDAIQEYAAIKRSPLNRALYYIESRLSHNLSLDQVAENAHVSSSYLSRLFTSTLGINFVTYVTHRKIKLACFLLKTTKHSIQHLAFELSFQDANYFGRVFKKEIGVTPTDYRKNIVKSL